MLTQYRSYRISLIVIDYLLTAIFLALVSRFYHVLPFTNMKGESLETRIFFCMAVALLWHVIFAFSGVYRLERVSQFFNHILKITPAHLLASMALAGLLFFEWQDVPRLLVVYFCSTLYVLFLLSRLAFTRFLARVRLHKGAATALIVGATDDSAYLARTMMDVHPRVFRIAGFVEDDPPAEPRLPAPILGNSRDVPRIIREYQIDLVIIAVGSARPYRLETLIAELSRQPVRIYLVADLLKMALVHGSVEQIGDLLIVGMREPAIQGPKWIMKRAMDILISTIGLLLVWPLFIAIAILIKLDSPGPVFYAPERVGEYGKIFRMFKFRSMFVDAEQRQSEVTTTDEKGNILYKSAEDPRITRVGKWLRRTSLDELPQLWNVLIGEMSLVGPRPEQPFLTQDYGKGEWQRVSVPPGITGWWQVRGRSDLPLHLNIEHDIYYVYNYSLLLDLKILFLTLGVVLKGKGAY